MKVKFYFLLILLVLPLAKCLAQSNYDKILSFENLCQSTNPEFQEKLADSLLNYFPAKAENLAWYRLAEGIMAKEMQNDLSLGLDFTQQAIGYFKQADNPADLAFAESFLFQLFWKQGNYQKAFQQYESASRLANLAKSIFVKDFLYSLALKNFADSQFKSPLPNHSIQHFQARTHLAQGKQFINQNNYQAAITSLEKSLTASGDVNLQDKLEIQGLLAICQAKEKQFRDAEKTLRNLQENAVASPRRFAGMLSFFQAELALEKKDYKSAESLLKNALSLFESSKFQEYNRNVYRSFISCYSAFKNSQQELKYQKLLLDLEQEEKEKLKALVWQSGSNKSEQTEERDIAEQGLKEAERTRHILKLNRILFVFALILVVAFALLLFRNTKRKEQLLRLENQKLADKVRQSESSLDSSLKFLSDRILNQSNEIASKLEQGMEQNNQEMLLSAKKSTNILLDLLKPAQLYHLLQSKDIELKKQRLELIPIIEDEMATKLDWAKKRNLTLDLVYAISPWSMVEIDEDLFRPLLAELLSNAIKFSNEHSNISIRLEASNHIEKERQIHGLELSISNHGPLISEEDLRSIFQAFYSINQLEEANNGFGLAFCKQVIEKHGGEIKAQNKNGQVCFSIWIPTYYEVLPLDEESKNIEEASQKEEIKLPAQPYFAVYSDQDDLVNKLASICPESYDLLKVSSARDLEYTKAKKEPLFIVLAATREQDNLDLLTMIKSDDSLQYIPVLLLEDEAVLKSRLDSLRLYLDDYLPLDAEREKLQASIFYLLAISENSNFGQPGTTEVDLLKEAWILLGNNFQDKGLNVAQLAKSANLKMKEYNRLLLQRTGMNPSAFLRELRLREAKRIYLKDGIQSASELAAKVGLNNAENFKELFKTRFGIELLN